LWTTPPTTAAARCWSASFRNLGFAAGNNLGVRHASGELLLLLNNDTQCLGSLVALVAVMRDRSVGVAGCMLRYADGRLQYSIGFEHTPSRIVLSWLGLGRFAGAARCFKRVESRADYYVDYRPEVDWVSGACLLTRRALWQRLGGFDETFFMYCEDVDYCRRVRLAGYTVAYAPAGEVLHYEGAGKLWAGESTLLRTSRSYLLYVSKHFGRGVRVAVGLGLGSVFLARSLCYGARAVLGRSAQLPREKFHAYARAAGFLVSAGVGLRDLEPQL
jgi:GT2 family glycosyltransferase